MRLEPRPLHQDTYSPIYLDDDSIDDHGERLNISENGRSSHIFFITKTPSDLEYEAITTNSVKSENIKSRDFVFKQFTNRTLIRITLKYTGKHTMSTSIRFILSGNHSRHIIM